MADRHPFLQSYRNFQRVVLPLSHAIGWAVLGVFVGAGEGVRAASSEEDRRWESSAAWRAGCSVAFVLEYSRLLLPRVGISRLIGFAMLGLGHRRVLRPDRAGHVLRNPARPDGGLKGKEFLLNQRRMRLGRSPRNEIALPSYEDLADRQAQVRIRKGEVVLVNLEPRASDAGQRAEGPRSARSSSGT